MLCVCLRKISLTTTKYWSLISFLDLSDFNLYIEHKIKYLKTRKRQDSKSFFFLKKIDLIS